MPSAVSSRRCNAASARVHLRVLRAGLDAAAHDRTPAPWETRRSTRRKSHAPPQRYRWPRSTRSLPRVRVRRETTDGTDGRLKLGVLRSQRPPGFLTLFALALARAFVRSAPSVRLALIIVCCQRNHAALRAPPFLTPVGQTCEREGNDGTKTSEKRTTPSPVAPAQPSARAAAHRAAPDPSVQRTSAFPYGRAALRLIAPHRASFLALPPIACATR